MQLKVHQNVDARVAREGDGRLSKRTSPESLSVSIHIALDFPSMELSALGGKRITVDDLHKLETQARDALNPTSVQSLTTALHNLNTLYVALKDIGDKDGELNMKMAHRWLARAQQINAELPSPVANTAVSSLTNPGKVTEQAPVLTSAFPEKPEFVLDKTLMHAVVERLMAINQKQAAKVMPAGFVGSKEQLTTFAALMQYTHAEPSDPLFTPELLTRIIEAAGLTIEAQDVIAAGKARGCPFFKDLKNDYGWLVLEAAERLYSQAVQEVKARGKVVTDTLKELDKLLKNLVMVVAEYAGDPKHNGQPFFLDNFRGYTGICGNDIVGRKLSSAAVRKEVNLEREDPLLKSLNDLVAKGLVKIKDGKVEVTQLGHDLAAKLNSLK